MEESKLCSEIVKVEDIIKTGSQANTQRLTNLILLIASAYTASCLVGLKIRNTGYQEYINRLKIEGKNRPRHMRSGIL